MNVSLPNVNLLGHKKYHEVTRSNHGSCQCGTATRSRKKHTDFESQNCSRRLTLSQILAGHWHPKSVLCFARRKEEKGVPYGSCCSMTYGFLMASLCLQPAPKGDADFKVLARNADSLSLGPEKRIPFGKAFMARPKGFYSTA